jgi:hypothetical protein
MVQEKNSSDESLKTMMSLGKPFWLVVGGIPTPLKNMSSSIGMMNFPYIMEK